DYYCAIGHASGHVLF
nr:immunoglobulin light chain junction region [Macaca mulatta]